MRVIAKKDNLFLVVEGDNIDLSCIFDKGFIINSNGQRISPLLQIGALTKDGGWEQYNADLNDIITNDNDYFEEIQNMVNNNQQYALENGSEPVKDKTLSKLKKFKLTSKYCKKDKNGKIELPNCCICLSEIMKGKETILLPCGHMFHSKCCLSWLKTNNTCPMCRFEIK